MDFNSLDLSCLKTIMDSGSFIEAAKKLNVTERRLRAIIRIYEARLGFKLLAEEGGGKLKATRAGLLFYKKSQVVEKVQKDLADYTALVQKGIETQIKIVTTFICPSQILIDILKEFKKEFNQVKIIVEQRLTEEPAKAILNSHADIAISCGNYTNLKLEKLKWRSVKFSAVAEPEHPANLPGIEEVDLNTMEYFVVNGKKMLNQRQYLGDVDDSYVWNLADFHTKKEYLINGFGWAYVPEELVQRELSEGLLQKIKCKKSYLKDLSIFRAKQNKLKPALNYLWQLFLDSHCPNYERLNQVN